MYNDTILYNQSYTRGGPVKCNRQPRRVQVTISKTPSIILSFADSMAQSHLQGGAVKCNMKAWIVQVTISSPPPLFFWGGAKM